MKLSAKEWASEIGGVFDDLEHYLNEDPPNLELARKRVKDGMTDLPELIAAIMELDAAIMELDNERLSRGD